MVSRQVRTGEADLGLRYQHDPDVDLVCEHLADEPLEIICASTHRLAGGTVAGLAEIATERWLAFPQRPDRPESHAAHAFGLFLAHGLGPISWRPVDSLSAQKRLVEAGFGLALIARSGAGEELARGVLSTIRVANLRPTQPVMAVTRAGAFLSPAVSELIDLLRAAYGAPAAEKGFTPPLPARP
jgi:DNA-binding transcriptional LysR family regulator